MLNRWRRSVIRIARWLPAAFAMTVAASLAGLGLHALHDWHHHGERGAGLFHLHFHVGHHHHHDDHDDDSEAPKSKFFTVAQVSPHSAPSAPSIAAPDRPCESVAPGGVAPELSHDPPTASSPRAPPA
jgi:hypothetical protein